MGSATFDACAPIAGDTDSPTSQSSRSKARYIREFDGLRGLSIGLVILYHSWAYQGTGFVGCVIQEFAGWGWCGVDVFFVLSGFLITGILLDTRESPNYWRNFFIRRGLRIFPLYYAVLLLMLIDAWLLARWGIGVRDPALQMIDRIWMNFLYVSNFSMAIEGSNHVPMNIAWSLAIEEQFYLIFPAIVLWCGRRGLTKALLAAVLLAPVLRGCVWAFGPQPAEGPYALPFCRMDALAMGALAQIAVRHWTAPSRRTVTQVTLLVCALAALTLLFWTRIDLPFIIVGYSLIAIAATALLISALLSSPNSVLRKVCGNSVLVYIGKLAYGLYLLHLMGRAVFDRFFMHLLPPGALQSVSFTALRSIGITAIAVLMATASYKFFEMPILRLKDRFAPSRQRYKEPVAIGAP